MCVATLAVAPLGIVEGGSHLLDGEVLLAGAAVGVLSSAIPYSFEVEALRRIATSVFGVLMSLEPAFAALAGLLVLGQHLGARVLVGIALVIVASVGASAAARRGRSPSAHPGATGPRRLRRLVPPRHELLHRPAVAVGVGEEHEAAPREVLDIAHLDASAASSACAASASATTICRPCTEPGAASVSPLPIAIEQAEPGGVSWTKRIFVADFVVVFGDEAWRRRRRTSWRGPRRRPAA